MGGDSMGREGRKGEGGEGCEAGPRCGAGF